MVSQYLNLTVSTLGAPLCVFCDLYLPQMFLSTELSVVWGKCPSKGPRSRLHVKNLRKVAGGIYKKNNNKKTYLETRSLYRLPTLEPAL